MIRRGEIRPLILSTLATRPMHGYEVIQELEARSGGRWRPSAGSIYPTLQQLADEGLLSSEEVDGRRVYSLTDEGEAAAEASPLPAWGDPGRGHANDVRHLARQVAEAAMQVQRVGTDNAVIAAQVILLDTRAKLYGLLAADGAIAADPADTVDGA
jgi:DNA-binding PadR family transcriptional regulator